MMPGAMRRLLRILISAATVLSLVLCVGALAAWVRSYQARDDILWTPEKSRVHLKIGTYRGGFFVVAATFVGTVDLSGPSSVIWKQSTPSNVVLTTHPTFFNQFGFGMGYSHDNKYPTRYLASRYWFVVMMTAILPAARLAGWRRRRRLRMHPNLCRHCGYDCRATPERCPECGSLVGAP
jgi:hypothetical protein